MRWGHLEGNVVALRVPLQVTVGEAALDRNLGGSQLTPMLEQRGEQNGMANDLDIRVEVRKTPRLEIAEGGNEIEISVQPAHGLGL